MKKSYWIIVLIVVVLINILGYFLFPFLHWSIGEEGFYLTPLLLGGALLLISIVLYAIKKAKKLQNNSSAIIFPVSLALIIGAGIHLMRFGSSAKAFDDYLYKYGTLYSKFGNKVIDSPLRTTSIALAFDSYGDKLFVLYDYDKKEIGEYWEDDLDPHGNCQYDYSKGDLKQTRCKHYDVSLMVLVYDKDGICYCSYDGSFEYYKNRNSSSYYRYYSDGAYYGRLFRVIHHRIEDELDVHITQWRVREVLKEGVTKDEYYLLDKIIESPWDELLSTVKTITEEQPTPSPVSYIGGNVYYGYYQIDLPLLYRALESEGYEIPDSSALRQRQLTSDITSYNENTENILNNIINSASTDDLNKLILFAYKYPDENLGRIPLFKGKFNGKTYILDSNYVITKVLNNLKDRGSLVDLQNGYYYIPKLKGKNKSIIYVWDSNNNQTIGQNGLNYDWFRNELFNKFYNYDINNLTVDDYNPAYGQFFVVSQHKKGGVLKFQGGGTPTKYNTVDSTCKCKINQ